MDTGEEWGDQESDVLLSFVAMEYYWLILNRTFKVFVTKEALFGVKIRGPMMSLPGYESDAKWLNPKSFVPSSIVNKYLGETLASNNIVEVNKDNFVLERSSIKSVNFDDTTKWGMGFVPHSGKLYVEHSSGRKREFILLGEQDGHRIKKELLA